MPRAVGRANGSNPVNAVLPCHRLIGATGSLPKYGCELKRKRAWDRGPASARERGHSGRNGRCGFGPRMRRSVAFRPEIAR